MALDDTIALLSGAPVFEHLDRDALRLIAFSAETRRLRPSEVLFRRGDRSDGAYLVTEGEVLVFRDDPEDATAAGPGSLIGKTALFIRTQRPASAAASRAATLLRVSPTLMRRVLEEFPASAAAVHAAVAQELAELNADLDGIRQTLLSLDGRQGSDPA